MRSSVIALAITLGIASGVVASETKDKVDTKDKKAKQEQAATPSREKVALTGSYIKQEVRRNGRITDGNSLVVVLDRETIERTGAADLKQLLVRQGIR